MFIGTILFDIQHEGAKVRLVVQGQPLGLAIDVTADDLERLADWLDREAAKLRPAPPSTEKGDDDGSDGS